MKTYTHSRLIALLLAAVMVFGLIGNGVLSVHAAAPATYTDIAVGQTKSVTISTSGSAKYFRFIPQYTAVYTFKSSDNADPRGYLLDSSGNTLTSDDDGGAGSRDFLISYNCVAGTTYYLKAAMWNSTTGTYTVSVSTNTPALETPDTPAGSARSYENTSTGDVFLGGKYIELGISRHGSFGTSATAPSGFHSRSGKLGMIVDGDGWDIGAAPTTGDFFLPDTPEERYILSYYYQGTKYEYIVADRNNVYSGSWKNAPAVHNQSSGDMLKAVVTGVTTHNVKLELTYSFNVNDKFYKTDVKITNNASAAISNVRFVRSFDPDQDDDIYNTNHTYNKVICNPVSTAPASDRNFAMVVARGEITLEGFFFIAFDNRARASQNVAFAPESAYLSGLWPETHTFPNYATDAAIQMSKTAVNGYSKYDAGIAITFNLESIAANQNETAQYYSSMSPDVEESFEEILNPVAPAIQSVTGATLAHGYRSGGPSISVRLADNHVATYQWYRNTRNSNTGGTLISGANSASYAVPLKHQPNTTEYYYCVVTATRTDNGLSASATSTAVAVVYQSGEHSWEEIRRDEPTCLTPGKAYYECEDCPAEKEEVLEAGGHNYGDWVIDTPATCTTAGSKHAICQEAGCGHRLDAYIPAQGHAYVSVVTKEATCTEPGIITHTCHCGDSYLTYIYAEHNYALTDHRDATCTVDGINIYTCTICDDTREEIIPGSHDYVAAITRIPTAENDGVITYTCSICGDTYEEAIPARPDAKVLLVQDKFPWTENNNVALLNAMVAKGYISGWDMATTREITLSMLSQYGVVLIANDQNTATYDRLGAAQEDLMQFANAGGVVVYGACDHGWASGNINHLLPEGVQKKNFYSHYNYIVDTEHPIVTGAYTDGKALTNTLLYGNYCSHTAFENLPADANIILQDGHGDPTLVEYPVGNGHIILSGLTWEFYYVRNAYDGRSSTTYTRNVYDDLVYYALLLNNSCSHAYDAGRIVPPTCTEKGYTLHTCEICGLEMKDNFIPSLGHTRGEGIIVREPSKTETGLKVVKCTVCEETLEEEILPMVDAPVVTVVSTTDPVILGQTFEAYVKIEDCDPVKSAAFVLDYDSDIFELVSVEWLKAATIQVTTPEIASAWSELTDINGSLLKLVFKANALTSGSLITVDAYVQTDGVVTLSVVGDTIAVVECPHERFTTESMDNTYHINSCVVCGYNTVSAHTFDHNCDTTCNECAYTREITHTAGERNHDGENHWYDCEVCGEDLDVTAHSYDNTCDTDCNVCGAVREITHTPKAAWEHNETEHWLDCDVCGMTIERHAHAYDDDTDCLCNICGYCRVMRGDVDGDGDVDSDDAVRLLLYTYFSEQYPLNQDGDMDGDGDVDSDDAVRILLFTYFPDQYPLHYPAGY